MDDARRGTEDGYRSGWLDGWRLGACQGIQLQHRPEPDIARPWTVMYVPQGFDAIDQGVEAALRANARDVFVVSAAQMRQEAERIRPDLVLVMNGLHVFPPDHLDQADAIRAMGIRTAIWFVDDPYVTDETVRIVPHYDYVFTHERSCIRLYEGLAGNRVYHLPLAAHPGLFHPQQVPYEYRSDICFIGIAFWNRVRLFDELAPYLKDLKVVIGGKLWDRMNRYAMLSKFMQERWIDVPETVKYYNGAKIVINLHRTTEAGLDNRNGINWPAESINPRTFEMASCATLQLTDWRSELPEHYEIGREIAIFHNAEELVELARHYLANEEERLRIATRGYRRTIRDHTFPKRIRTLLDTVGLHA